MTVKEFFATKGGTNYYEVNICNMNTDEMFHTNADEIDNEDIFEHSGYDWGNSKIASWEFDGETLKWEMGVDTIPLASDGGIRVIN